MSGEAQDPIVPLVLKLAEIAEETRQPGYHGPGNIPRFFELMRAFMKEQAHEDVP